MKKCKTKHKMVMILIGCLILMWGSFFVTDYIRCKNDQTPIFCVDLALYDDGGSVYYVGLFYNYYRVRTFNPEIDMNESCSKDCYLTDYVITPWFFDLDYAKAKAFGNS